MCGNRYKKNPDNIQPSFLDKHRVRIPSFFLIQYIPLVYNMRVFYIK